MAEIYSYNNHPDIDSFRDFLRPDTSQDHLSPYVLRLMRESERLNNEVNTLLWSPNLPSYAHPLLLPQEADQPLMVTAYDNFDGMEAALAPEEQVEAWKKTWVYNLMLANHPSRIAAMKLLENHGFRPPQTINSEFKGVIDLALERGVMLQLSDLGQNRDIQMSLLDEEKLQQISHEMRYAQSGVASLQPSEDEFVQSAMNTQQTHRTNLLATGPFSMIGRQARSFVGLGAMPDINGSVLMLETAAKMHMLSEVPEVGFFSSPEKQANLARAVLETLTINDPLLKGRSAEDKAYIVDHWKRNIVGVLEVDTKKALLRSEKLYEAGVRTFRVYGHTAGGDIVQTVQELRRKYGETIEIFGSQITDVRTALAVEQVGADGIIVGVGSGGRCTTADLSDLIPSNAVLPWMLRGKLGISVIGEGGGVDNPTVAALVGMSGVNGSGSLGGGTLETPGGISYFKKGNDFYKPYGGEASRRTKIMSNRIYPTGDAYFPEGEETFKQLNLREVSMTQKVIKSLERIVLGGVVLNVNAGPYVIEEMQKLTPSPLWEKSTTTQYLQQTH